jgi:hypothetical protein
LLNNTIKHCQQFLAIIHNNPNGENLLDQQFITTRKVSHLSKKIQLEKSALALGSKLNKEGDLISSTTSFRILKETGGEEIYNTQPSANKMRTVTICCDSTNVAVSGTTGGKIHF